MYSLTKTSPVSLRGIRVGLRRGPNSRLKSNFVVSHNFLASSVYDWQSSSVRFSEAEGSMTNFDTAKNKLLASAAFIMEYRDAYYELSRLSRIACTLPVTSAEAERSFSYLKLVKTRTTMLDAWLSNFSALSMHSVVTNTLDLEHVIDMFASKYPNCPIAVYNCLCKVLY